jgi:hypothetical protein
LWENPPTWRPELSPGTPKSKYLYDECNPRLLTFFFAKKRKKGEGKQTKNNLRKPEKTEPGNAVSKQKNTSLRK